MFSQVFLIIFCIFPLSFCNNFAMTIFHPHFSPMFIIQRSVRNPAKPHIKRQLTLNSHYVMSIPLKFPLKIDPDSVFVFDFYPLNLQSPFVSLVNSSTPDPLTSLVSLITFEWPTVFYSFFIHVFDFHACVIFFNLSLDQ